VERADIGIGQADRLTAIAIELADRSRERNIVEQQHAAPPPGEADRIFQPPDRGFLPANRKQFAVAQRDGGGAGRERECAAAGKGPDHAGIGAHIEAAWACDQFAVCGLDHKRTISRLHLEPTLALKRDTPFLACEGDM